MKDAWDKSRFMNLMNKASEDVPADPGFCRCHDRQV